MLSRAVVEDHVQHELDAVFLSFLGQFFKVCHGPKEGIDSGVIRYIIAIIPLRTRIEGVEPDDIDTQFLQIRQFFDDSTQVPHTISGRIFIGFWINLVDNLSLIKGHSFSFFLFSHKHYKPGGSCLPGL